MNPYNPAAIWGNYIQFVEGVKDEENISRARAQKGVKGNNIDLLCSLFCNKVILFWAFDIDDNNIKCILNTSSLSLISLIHHFYRTRVRSLVMLVTHSLTD